MQTESEFNRMVEEIIIEAINFGKSRIFPDLFGLEEKKINELTKRINNLFSERFYTYSSFTFGD